MTDVRFYTPGFINTEIFQSLFKYLSLKASTMQYWNGVKKTSKSSSTFGNKLDDILLSSEMDTSLFSYSASKPGPSIKLSLENEFFFTLMTLHCNLLQQNLDYIIIAWTWCSDYLAFTSTDQKNSARMFPEILLKMSHNYRLHRNLYRNAQFSRSS